MIPPTRDDASPETTETLLAEVDARLSLLEARRPKSLDGFKVSSISKLPFNALIYREALLWRTVQLGRSAFEAFQTNKLVSAILLTRATVEASAALWHLQEKLGTIVESHSLGNISNDLVTLLMGSRSDTDILPTAVNVLTFVDRVDKDIPGFRHQYDRLSEIAHPNWVGTAFLFSKVEPRGIANFGENIRGLESIRRVGAVNLSVALLIFEAKYNQITDLMPSFVALCELSGEAQPNMG